MHEIGYSGGYNIELDSAHVLTEAVDNLFFDLEKKENKEKKKIVFSDILAVEALPYTIVAGSYSFINGIIASYLVMYADELGISGVSVYFTVCAAVLDHFPES